MKMVTSSMRVVPDGLLMDHVAEFAYEPEERIQTLFLRDEEGYIDAVAKLIQTMATGGSIGASQRKGAIHSTDRLKEALAQSGRLTLVNYFDPRHKEQRLANASAELKLSWDKICGELEDFTSEASVAFLGHIRREFHYIWLREDPQFTGDWYSKPEEALLLTDGVRQRTLREISSLAKHYKVSESDSMFDAWINECATSHYRIFFEYLLYLGSETGEEYMPALTRSSLRFLPQRSDALAKQIVLPFVALEAVQKVKKRCDLVPCVVEWAQGPGRKVVEGFQELQSILRSTRDPQQEQQILSNVESILSSEWSREFTIALDLLRMGASAWHGQAELDAAKDALKLSRSTSYRWLWSIRSPDVKAQWRKWVRTLAQAPH
jgi:hypothetical protein